MPYLKIDWTTKQPTITEELWINHLTSSLVSAAFLGHLGIVELLFDHGAEIHWSEPMEDGDDSPILAAARSGNIEIVR